MQYHGSVNWYKQVADVGSEIEHLPFSEPSSISSDYTAELMERDQRGGMRRGGKGRRGVEKRGKERKDKRGKGRKRKEGEVRRGGSINKLIIYSEMYICCCSVTRMCFVFKKNILSFLQSLLGLRLYCDPSIRVGLRD